MKIGTTDTTEKIIQKTLSITPEQNQTNVLIPFRLNSPYKCLTISFQYGPAYADKEEAVPLIQSALMKYLPEGTEVTEEIAREFLPLENLVTLSLACDGNYLGARHTKERDLEVVITASEASLGFLPHAVEDGEWELQLNVHSVASAQVDARVSIFAERGCQA